MRQSLRLGRIGGVPLGAHWSVAVIMLLLVDLLASSALPAAAAHQTAFTYWAVATVTAAAYLASLLAHEVAHAMVARRNGIRVRSITLWMLGGVTELEGEPRGPGADLRIALAGPATSACAALAFLGLAELTRYAGAGKVVVAGLIWLALMNGILAVFNLLPGAPLDGGRVLRAISWHRSGDRRAAERTTARAGRLIGVVLGGVGLGALLYGYLDGLWLVLVGGFMVVAATGEEAASAATAALAGVRVADVMAADPDIAPAWLTVGDFVDQLPERPARSAWPVVDFHGELAGVVTIAQLGRVPPDRRSDTRLGQVAMAVPPDYQAAPDDPAASLLARRPIAGEVVAIVMSGHRVAGIVTSAGLQRELQWRSLATAGR